MDIYTYHQKIKKMYMCLKKKEKRKRKKKNNNILVINK